MFSLWLMTKWGMAMGSLYCQLVADGANTFLFIVFPFLSFCSSLNHGFTLNFVAVGSSHHFLFRPPCRSKQLNRLSTSWHYLFYSMQLIAQQTKCMFWLGNISSAVFFTGLCTCKDVHDDVLMYWCRPMHIF